MKVTKSDVLDFHVHLNAMEYEILESGADKAGSQIEDFLSDELLYMISSLKHNAKGKELQNGVEG